MESPLCFSQVDSDGEEKQGDCSRDALDQSCEHAREQLTNSIRQQWRKLRNHVEKLDSRGTRGERPVPPDADAGEMSDVVFVCQASQVQNQLQASRDVIPRETHEDEMEEMRREVQQCKEFIQAQQQLLQVGLIIRLGAGLPSRFYIIIIFFCTWMNEPLL